MTNGGGRIQVEVLPMTWFDRAQYRPRIGNGWYLLDERFRPTQEVPVDPPREPAGDGTGDSPGGRAAVAAAISAIARDWDLPVSPEADRSLRSISIGSTAAIVAGQQPGFLGGPLLVLYKAITAIAAARRREDLTGTPCVPIFWVASEDHDLDEVRETRMPGPGGEEAIYRLPHESDRRPLSDFAMDDRALAILDAAREAVSKRRHGDEAARLLDLYRGRSLASGFAAMLASLLGRFGLIVVEPAPLRRLARGLFQRVIEEPEAVLAAIDEGRRRVEEAGLEPFVAGRLPLFILLEGRRQHLSPAPGGLRVDGGGPLLERKALLEQLERSPESFSAAALLRPLIQDATLPSVLTIGGPAEVGYFAQLGPLAKFLGVPPPRIALRFGATLFDGKLASTTVSGETLAAARSPEDLLPPAEEPPAIARARTLPTRLEAELRDAVASLPAGPEIDRLNRRARDLAADVDGLFGRISRANAASSGRELESARRYWRFAFPGDGLQERRWAWIHFVARHGTDWIEELLTALRQDPLRVGHRRIVFPAGNGDGAR